MAATELQRTEQQALEESTLLAGGFLSFFMLCVEISNRLSLSLLTINATDYRTHFIRNTNAPVFLLGKAASSVCCLPAQPLVDAKPV